MLNKKFKFKIYRGHILTGIPPSIMWSHLVSEIQIFSSKHVIMSLSLRFH